ncbi:hypothetical protein J6590_068518 [Homalodisca vitripennis]|nr:hypothetical protein J6590_068518 [Homalodisca vitripennis]
MLLLMWALGWMVVISDLCMSLTGCKGYGLETMLVGMRALCGMVIISDLRMSKVGCKGHGKGAVLLGMRALGGMVTCSWTGNIKVAKCGVNRDQLSGMGGVEEET